MVKFGRLPGCRVVAGFTGLRKSSGHVIRVCGALEILQVTGNARRTRQVVIVIDVAVRALARWNRMRPSQCESGGAVIEGRGRPTARAVALRTGLGKIRAHVIWIRGALEVLQVTRHAR
jgi:hypothetical protein